jgi:hypothetical protein
MERKNPSSPNSLLIPPTSKSELAGGDDDDLDDLNDSKPVKRQVTSPGMRSKFSPAGVGAKKRIMSKGSKSGDVYN